MIPVALIGRPEVTETDPRFADLESRSLHIDDLYGMVAGILATRTTAYWLEELEKADIPVMPLNTMDSLIEDPHLAAVGFFKTVEHPTEGAFRSMAVPSTWSASQPEPERLAPRLGEHSVELLREAGLGDEAIAALLAERAAVQADPAARRD